MREQQAQRLHAREELAQVAGREEQRDGAELARPVEGARPRAHRALQHAEALRHLRGLRLAPRQLLARVARAKPRPHDVALQELGALLDGIERLQQTPLLALVERNALAARLDRLADPLEVAGLAALAAGGRADQQRQRQQRAEPAPLASALLVPHARDSLATATPAPKSPSALPASTSASASRSSKKRGATPPSTSSSPNSRPGSTSRKIA